MKFGLEVKCRKSALKSSIRLLQSLSHVRRELLSIVNRTTVFAFMTRQHLTP